MKRITRRGRITPRGGHAPSEYGPAYHRCMEERRGGRRQPDGSAHNRYPGFADLDRVLEPVEFAAHSSVEGRAWIAALPQLLDQTWQIVRTAWDDLAASSDGG